MTQPSPQDNLPPGPWRWDEDWLWAVDGTLIGQMRDIAPAIARAIAAIPEMRAEIDRLRAENERLEGEISTTMTMRLKAENDRLRAENASLRQESVQYAQEADRLRVEEAELIEMLATRTTHPEYMELLRRYRRANDTEA